MRRRRLLVGAVLAVIALVAFAGGAAIAGQGSPRKTRPSPAQTLALSCHSAALGGTLPALIYLPAGYRGGSTRYRVIYFLHGLPADPDSYKQNAFVATALAGSSRAAIVVAPQGSRGTGSDREYLNWDASEDWPQAIANDLPHCVDTRFRTIANRTGRALVGLSAGGYGAFNIGLRNLATFGAVESWSGYFAATDPSGLHVLELGSVDADDGARVPSGSDLKAALARWPALIAFYVGNQDSRFLATNQAFDGALRVSGVRHVFRVYAGGHSGALWRAHAPHWLAVALDSLAREAHRRSG